MIYDVQKASVLKRASAFLLDIIIIACLSAGFIWLLALICDYQTHYDTHASILAEEQQKVYDKYKQPNGFEIDFSKSYDNSIGEEYNANLSDEVKAIILQYQETGIDLSIEDEEFQKLSESEQKAFYACALQASDEYSSALKLNETYGKESMLVFSLAIMMSSIGIFLAVLVWEFIIPLFLKNGQTVGKKVFGIAVMHTNGVRVRPFSMFVRSILGKYVFELMVPIFVILMMFFGILSTLIGAIVIALIAVLQIGIFIYTKNSTRSFLHDLISRTVTVDLASQMIFENEGELLEFKKQEQRTIDERNNYRENGGFDFYNSALNYRGGKKIVEAEENSNGSDATEGNHLNSDAENK